MYLLTAVISFIVLMTLVVGVHEYGHYLAARLSKVRVKAIGFGFGRALYTWKNAKGIRINLAPFFIGGYVSLLDSRNETVSQQERAHDFSAKPARTRFFILIAGIVMNFLFAFVCFSLVFVIGMRPLVPNFTKIDADSVFYDKGMAVQDKVVEVGSTRVLGWSAFAMAIAANLGDKEPLPIVVKKENGSLHSFTIDLSKVRLQVKDLDLFKALGVEPNKKNIYIVRYPLLKSIYLGVETVFTITRLNLQIIKKILTGYISPLALAGPLTMIEQAQYYFLRGLVWFCQFVGLLSIAVALANLLPIPGLDGGQIMLLGLEKLRGKPLSIEWEQLLQRLGYIVLFMICMQLLANDFQRMSLGGG